MNSKMKIVKTNKNITPVINENELVIETGGGC